jgi:hypothetical protein
MAKRIEVRLTDNPSNNDAFSILINAGSEFFFSTYGIVFKTTPGGGVTNNIQIGANVGATAVNLYNHYVSYFSAYSFITVTQQSNGIDITINSDPVTASTISTIGDIDIDYIDVVVPPFTRDNIVLSRSPYNVILQPTSLFDSATLNIKIYRGTQTTDAPTTDTFVKSKSVVQAGQSKIRFEISRMINDYCKSSIPTFGGVGAQTSTVYDSVWVDAVITAYYLGDAIGSADRQYLAIDGYGNHTELWNPKLTKNVLTTNDTHIVYKGSDYPIYFVTKNLTDIIIDGVSVAFTLDSEINNQIVAYVNIGAYIDTQETFTAVFVYDDVTETHTIIVKDECKYPLYNCFFKNKYGFWQSIPFNMRNKQTLQVESTKYMPVTSVYGEYSLSSHGQKTYQPSAKELITCNTDFIPEYYNDLFTEMMLSELVYLENKGTYLPVNVSKNSIEKKTKVFEKLIQYSMDFEYSFNVMNTVI